MERENIVRFGLSLLIALAVTSAAACGGGEEEQQQEPCPGEAERNPITGNCTTEEAPDTDIRNYDDATEDVGPEDTGPEDAEGDVETVDAGTDSSSDTMPSDSGGGTDDAGDTDDTGGEDTATADASGAIVEGTVSRAEDTTLEEDGVGNLYVALTPDDPRTNPETEPVAFDLIEDADLSDPSNSVEYRLTGIEPRSEDYYISAFLDDDGDASGGPSEAGPDKNDLMNLTDTFGVPTISLPEEKTYEHDIVLTTGLPIDP